MADPSSEPAWLAEIRDELGKRSEAIGLALNDVAEICANASSPRLPVGWVDLRDDKRVTVFVVAPGWLHRLSGERDPDVTESEWLTNQRASKCDYRAFPITRDSFGFSMSLSLAATGEWEVSPARRWIFQLGHAGEFDPLVLDPVPAVVRGQTVEKPPSDEHTPFARALAAEIVAAGDETRGASGTPLGTRSGLLISDQTRKPPR